MSVPMRPKAQPTWGIGLPTALLVALSSVVLCASCAHRGPYDFGGSVKLGDLHSGGCMYPLKRPKGAHHCRLIVTCAKVDRDRLHTALKGKAVVKRDGQSVAEFSFSPETVKECPWLKDKRVLAAYFLHGETTLDETISKRGDYSVEVILSGQPPSGSAVWLFYLPWHFALF